MIRPTSCFEHALCGAFGDPVRRGQVRVQHGSEVVLGHPQQEPVPGDAGVRDEDLDGASEVFLDGSERGVDLAGVGDIAPDPEQAVGWR